MTQPHVAVSTPRTAPYGDIRIEPVVSTGGQPASELSPFPASPLITFKRYRVPENTVAHVGRKADLGDDIYLDLKAVLQVIGQRNQVEQRATLLHIDKKIKIAGGTLFPASGRTEHAHVARPMDGSDTADVLSDLRSGDRSGGSPLLKQPARIGSEA